MSVDLSVGLSVGLLETIDLVRASLNPALTLEGIVGTMVDVRNSLGKQVLAEVRRHFGERVFETVIPRNVRLSEAPSHGKPILLYDVRSRGALAYLRLAEELLRRLDAGRNECATPPGGGAFGTEGSDDENT